MRKFIGFISLALLLSACGGGSAGKGKWGGNREDVKRRDPLVEVVPVQKGNISRVERSTGRIEAHNLADVYVQLSEVATDVLVEEGDSVQEGQVLARLDRAKSQLQVEASTIAVNEAQKALDSDKLDLAKKKADFERIQRYFDPKKPEASSIYTKDAYDAAKLENDKAANVVASSEYALQRAQGELAVNLLQLENTVIKAPISGVITERDIRANQLVSNGSLAFRIADFGELEVKLDVAEAGLSDLRQPARVKAIGLFGLREKVDMSTAQAVLMSVTAFPEARILGYVDRVSPTVDETRGMIVVTVHIIQPQTLLADDVDADAIGRGAVTAANVSSKDVRADAPHKPLLDQLDPNSVKAVLQTAIASQTVGLRPGMWVDARISTNVEKQVLLVPGAAVVGDAEVIWLVDIDKSGETGTARRIDVSKRRGVNSEGSFELVPAPGDAPKNQHVKEGALVVVRGQSLLREGAKVRVKDLTQ